MTPEVVLPRAWFPWNGSKRWLLPSITDVLRRWTPISGARYFEPFVGSGSVSRLVRQMHPDVPQVVGDAHPWLASAFESQLEKGTYTVPENYLDFAHWRSMRDVDIQHLTINQRADRFAICLFTAWGNRWRTSVSGSFNMLLNPKFCQPDKLRAQIETFRRTRWLGTSDTVYAGGWQRTCAKVHAGDLVYLDPPYPETFGYGMPWSLDDLFDLIEWAETCPGSVVISNISALARLLARAGFATVVTQARSARRTTKQRREVIAWALRGPGRADPVSEDP